MSYDVALRGTVAKRRSGARLRFSERQCQTFFDAVLVDDRIDPHAELPPRIHLDYDQVQLDRCFAICRQVWRAGLDRRSFRGILGLLLRGRTLDAAQKKSFCDVRAKFKQLRFACANFDERHRYPAALHWVTSIMGHLQDDCKNARTAAAAARALLLRLSLNPVSYRVLAWESGRFRATSPEGFRRYVTKQVALLRASLDKPEVTGEEFHDLRKIVSRQSSFYVSLVTLYPSAYHQSVFRGLATLNGMMGRMHDELIEKKVCKLQDYRCDTFALPFEIRQRLIALAARYPAG